MIIGIVGFMGSGKDTVANMLLQEENCVKDSFAAPLKDLCASVFGWPRHLLEGDTVESRDFRDMPDVFWSRKTGIDHFTPRLALQLVGTDVMRDHFHKDIWLNSLEYRLRTQSSKKQCVIISDARFKNELDLIKQMGGAIVQVRRGDPPEWYDVAVRANEGNAVDRRIMQTRYRDVHRSEWDWVGYDVDFIVYNNSSMEYLEKEIRGIQLAMQSKMLKVV